MAQYRKFLASGLLSLVFLACLGGRQTPPNSTPVGADAIAVVQQVLLSKADEVQIPKCDQGNRLCMTRLLQATGERLGLQALVNEGVWTAQLNQLNSRWRVTVVLGDEIQSYLIYEGSKRVVNVPD